MVFLYFIEIMSCIPIRFDDDSDAIFLITISLIIKHGSATQEDVYILVFHGIEVLAP